MYVVIRDFFDLMDNSFFYKTGDTFPREGYRPSSVRIQTLLSSNNAWLSPFIAKKTVELDKLKLSELKVLASEKGIEISDKVKKDELIRLIGSE